MRCPNCHSVVGNNYGLCQYCGYDIGKYVRSVQDEGKKQSNTSRDRRSTLYVQEKTPSRGVEYNYENGYLYYKKAYEKERRKNERIRQTALYGIALVFLLLHGAELLFLAIIYMA